MGMHILQDALTMVNWGSSIISLLQKYVNSHLSIYQYSQEITLDKEFVQGMDSQYFLMSLVMFTHVENQHLVDLGKVIYIV